MSRFYSFHLTSCIEMLCHFFLLFARMVYLHLHVEQWLKHDIFLVALGTL